MMCPLKACMEVLLRRICCVWCNTEAGTPPQHGGGRPLRKFLTSIYFIFVTCLVHAQGLRNRHYYLILSTHVF